MQDVVAEPGQRIRPATPPMRGVRERHAARSLIGAALDVGLAAIALVLATALRAAEPMRPFWSGIGLAGATRFLQWTDVHTAILLFQAFTMPLALAVLGLYRLEPDRGVRPGRIVAAVATTHLALFGFLYLFRVQDFPRSIVVLDLVCLLAFLPAWRAVAVRSARRRLASGEGLRNVLVVGTDATAQAFAQELAADPTHGRRVVGFVADTAAEGRLRVAVVENTRRDPQHMLDTVGSTDDIAAIIDGLCVEEVFVSDRVAAETVVEVARASRARGVEVAILPAHNPDLGPARSTWLIGRFAVMGITETPIPQAAWTVKRAIDVAGAATALVLTAPVVAAAALAIKIEDPRLPVFYRGTRVGLKGRHFGIWKLTTMRADADDHRDALRDLNTRHGPWFQIDADRDPRLTRVGRVLRKSTINEIPQFWNVLKGEMSLVGPRPLHPDEVSQFVDHDMRYYRCFDVKPGMTGLWQVEARRDPSFERRIALDFRYIDTWSLGLDLALLARTPLALFRSRGD